MLRPSLRSVLRSFCEEEDEPVLEKAKWLLLSIEDEEELLALPIFADVMKMSRHLGFK